MDSKKFGIFAVLGAAVMWSIEPILAKLSYSNASVAQTFGIRTLTIAIVALLYAAFTKGSLKTSKKEFSVLVYIALAATIFSEFMYLYALTKIPIINVVIIGHTQPLYIALLAYFFLKEEKLTKYDYLGIFFMIAASLLVTTRTLSNLAGFRLLTFCDFMVVIASVSWATTAIAMKKYLKGLNTGTIAFYRYGISSIILVIYLAYNSNFFVSNIYQVFIGINVGIGVILYYESLKRIKAAQVSAWELVTPFFAAALGYIFFKETVTLLQIIGIIVLVFGVRFLAKKEN